MRTVVPTLGHALRAPRVVVLIVCLLATAAAVFYVHRPHGVFWTDTSVYFIAPSGHCPHQRLHLHHR